MEIIFTTFRKYILTEKNFFSKINIKGHSNIRLNKKM